MEAVAATHRPGVFEDLTPLQLPEVSSVLQDLAGLSA
jgi:hypothetical protein